MFKPLPLFLGLRYSRSRRRNGFIAFISASSLIGIALGVMALILGLSAMNGFERELKDRVLSVVPQGELDAVERPLPDWPRLRDYLLARLSFASMACWSTALPSRGCSCAPCCRSWRPICRMRAST